MNATIVKICFGFGARTIRVGFVNRDRKSALIFHESETWDIRRTVPDVDHVLEWNRSLGFRDEFVDGFVIRQVVTIFVDPE